MNIKNGMVYYPPFFNNLKRKRFHFMATSSSNTKEKILNELLQFTLTKCMNILNARSGSIFLFDDKTEELVLRIARNGRRVPAEGIRQPLGEGVAGLVASRREPVLVKNINKDSRFITRKRFNHYRSHSFISVPLEFAGELIGVINITERNTNGVFGARDLKLLLDLCSFFAFFVYQLNEYSDDEVTSHPKFSLPGRLATGLIHELNNPLDGIIRYINLSLNCLGEESIVKEYLMESKKGLNRIVKIVRSLLDFRKIASFTPVTIDVNKVLEESMFLMNHYFISGRIAITKCLQQDLPLVHDHGLKLVFTNILKNACDAIGPGQGRISIFSERNDGFVDIKISDTGPGVPEEIRNNIFEPFFTTKEMGKGSGLGLAICLNIVERYKGCILLESEEGKGSTFTIRLPEESFIKQKERIH